MLDDSDLVFVGGDRVGALHLPPCREDEGCERGEQVGAAEGEQRRAHAEGFCGVPAEKCSEWNAEPGAGPYRAEDAGPQVLGDAFVGCGADDWVQ